MYKYRIELRIFGLLSFALLATLLLAYGLEVAGVKGELLGVKFTVVGSSAFFIVLVLIFFATGLFKFGLEEEKSNVLNYPIENLSLEEIELMLDELLVSSRKIDRRKRQLEATKAALQAQLTPDEIMQSSGITIVRRPIA
jgi:hypothetical protein